MDEKHQTSQAADQGQGGKRNHQQALDVSIDVSHQEPSKLFDEDDLTKRTGSEWTASAHIITAVIGSGVLSLAWAIAQLGWIVGPLSMVLFTVVTYYMSTLLTYCYRTGDQEYGKRNPTYVGAVKSILGGFRYKLCCCVQFLNLFGVSIGYTIAASTSMMAVKRSNCYHRSGGKDGCHMNGNLYMMAFGIAEIIFSQIPDFHKLWWLSIVAALMSFTYAFIGLGLGLAKTIGNKMIKGNLTGITVGYGHVTQSQKTWRTFQALGDIAFSYSYSTILIEIQDTIKYPPTESKTMRKAIFINIVITSFFYMLCGCFGYAAFGDSAPGNLLTGFGFYNPFWLVDIANIAIVIHLFGGYQVYCQPIFTFVENATKKRFPNNDFVTKEIEIPIPGCNPYKMNLFRLVWRTVFVILTTEIAMLLPFFNDVMAFLGAIAFWPLTVYFPMAMYFVQMRIPKWSKKWVCLNMLSVACLIVSIVAAVGSVVGIVQALKLFKPFGAHY